MLERDPAQLEVDSFFVRFLSGVERALAPADYALLLQLVPPGGASARGAYERLAAAGRVDGFLLTDVEVDDPRFALLEAAGLPVVIAGRPVAECPFRLGRDRARRGHGRRRRAPRRARPRADRVLRRARRATSTCRRALACWRATLAAAGLEPGPVVHAEPSGVAAERALEGRPTAVVCTSDVLALAVVAAARERGLAVPGDVSVTGFDDSPLAALSSPAADVGARRLRRVRRGGRRRAAGRDRRRAGAGRTSPSAPELVVRASSGPPR